MKNWSEFHISIVYYTGLLLSTFTGILVISYCKQDMKGAIVKITGKFHTFWQQSFKTTIILTGLLGAISVSFRDCNGKYDYLLKSRHETVAKGLEQISASYLSLASIIGFWLFLFLIMHLSSLRKKDLF